MAKTVEEMTNGELVEALMKAYILEERQIMGSIIIELNNRRLDDF